MRFGKKRMFIYVQLIAVLVLAIYLGIWSLSTQIEAKVQGTEFPGGNIIYFRDPAAILVEYDVKGKTYLEQFPRDNIPFTQKTLRIRYLNFAPTVTRIDNFQNIWLVPLLFYAFWFFVTGLLLLTHNVVFSKNTVFETYNRYPWISMHEFFPYKTEEEDEPFFRFKFHKRPKKPRVRKIE